MLDAIAGAVLFLSQAPELSLIVKATVILSVTLAIAGAATRARASVRHVIVASSFAALIALPLVLAAAPPIRFEVAAPQARTPVATAPIVERTSVAATAEDAPRPVASLARALPLSTTQWARMVWLAGAIAFLLPVVMALWRLSVIRRTGIPVAWHRAELARLADARGVALPVELLEHEAVPGPMTFGLRRPVIVLPPDAREWSGDELRRALLHELEHIQRGDWLMQIVARSVAALYWFHPLVWSAWRRLCLEAERSCDDAVVISEEKTDYAEQLVTLAHRMAATPVQPMLGMANRSDLSTRVTAVLDDRLKRGRAGLTFAAGTLAAAALVVVAVAPVRAIAKPSTDQAAALS
jgi:beta-lactamase regulating signal transducer with metallopeptidase domain